MNKQREDRLLRVVRLSDYKRKKALAAYKDIDKVIEQLGQYVDEKR